MQLSHNGLNDLSPKIGELIAGRKNIHRYPTLAPFDLYQTEHTYFVAIYDDVHKDSFLTCAAIRFVPETILKYDFTWFIAFYEFIQSGTCFLFIFYCFISFLLF